MPVGERSTTSVPDLLKEHLPEVIEQLVKLAKDDTRREIQLEAIKLFLAYALGEPPPIGGLLDLEDELEDE